MPGGWRVEARGEQRRGASIARQRYLVLSSRACIASSKSWRNASSGELKPSTNAHNSSGGMLNAWKRWRQHDERNSAGNSSPNAVRRLQRAGKRKKRPANDERLGGLPERRLGRGQSAKLCWKKSGLSSGGNGGATATSNRTPIGGQSACSSAAPSEICTESAMRLHDTFSQLLTNEQGAVVCALCLLTCAGA